MYFLSKLKLDGIICLFVLVKGCLKCLRVQAPLICQSSCPVCCPCLNLTVIPPALCWAGQRSKLTQTSQDEKTLNLNVILLGPQRIHCVWIQKDIPGCERDSFLFSAHWPPPSLSGAACLFLTTAACCLWRPGVSGAAPDICRPWARAAWVSFFFAHTCTGAHSLPGTKSYIHPAYTVCSGEEGVWRS